MELTVKHTHTHTQAGAHTRTRVHTPERSRESEREREKNNTQIFPVAYSQQSIKILVNYISAPGP